MTDIPAPRTAAEFFALPEGPGFSAIVLTPTAADRARGYMEWRGHRIQVADDVCTYRIPVMSPVVAIHLDDTTPLGYCDQDGVWWRLGRYADGSWFRQRSGA